MPDERMMMMFVDTCSISSLVVKMSNRNSQKWEKTLRKDDIWSHIEYENVCFCYCFAKMWFRGFQVILYITMPIWASAKVSAPVEDIFRRHVMIIDNDVPHDSFALHESSLLPFKSAFRCTFRSQELPEASSMAALQVVSATPGQRTVVVMVVLVVVCCSCCVGWCCCWCCKWIDLIGHAFLFWVYKNHQKHPKTQDNSLQLRISLVRLLGGQICIGNRGSHNRVQDACATASAATTAAKSVAAAVAEKRSDSSATYPILVTRIFIEHHWSWPEITLFERGKTSTVDFTVSFLRFSEGIQLIAWTL